MSGTWYWPALGLVIAGGILPAAYFTWSWRPQRRWSARQLDAGGWVHVILALYLLAAFRGVAGHYRLPSTVPEAVASLAVGAAIDVVLWIRVLRWVSFRRDPDQPQRRAGDPAPSD